MLDITGKENVSFLDYKKEWKIQASTIAKRCRNKIREVVENIDLQPNPEKQVIAFSLGDPTVYGNLPPSSQTVEAVITAVKSSKYNGYAPCVGTDAARRAVSSYLSRDDVEPRPEDIILCSGCSSSLEMCIAVLADGEKSQNILVPRPGFPIYQTLAECMGIETKLYNLVPERDWEIDLTHLESLIDEKTAAIVVNNPSNPCGSVFNIQHLRDIVALAVRYRIPVIADEIYDSIVFPGHPFTSLTAIGAPLPILVCGGLAKRFLVPGWRLGWIYIHDPVGAFDPEIRNGLQALSQRTIGSNTLMQAALPTILLETHHSFYEHLIDVLKRNAEILFENLKEVKGLKPFMPQGTMYMMVKIELEEFPCFENGLEFVKKMMEEESVFCLPGECFFFPGYVRIVMTVPEELIVEGCKRIKEFCERYYLGKDCNNI